MHRTAEFHGPIDGRIVIPAPHCGPGGSMSFNFGGYDAANGTIKGNPNFKRFHAANIALLYRDNKAKARAILDRAIQPRP